MAPSEDETSELPTNEGRLVVALSKALFDKDVDTAFQIMGEYLDQHDLQVSEAVIVEYRFADRVK